MVAINCDSQLLFEGEQAAQACGNVLINIVTFDQKGLWGM